MAADAMYIDTTSMPIESVVEQVLARVLSARERRTKDE
jgi:cytidylate kinase